MAEFGTVLRLDARRTTIVVAIPVLAGLGAAVAWRALIPGVGSWDGAVAAISAAVRLLCPLAATLAAWAALRAERLDYLRTLGARSPATGPLLDLLLLCAVTLLAYGVVVLVVVVQTLLHPAAPGFHPVGVLAGAAALAMCVAAGYVAGRQAPHPLAVAAVAGSATAWSVLRPAGHSWLSLLPPASIQRVGLYTGLRPGPAADQVIWALGVGTALVAAYLWTLSHRRLLVIPLAMAVGATAYGTVRLHGDGGSAVGAAPPTEPRCRSWPLIVCVHPALLPALPALETTATPLASRLAGTPGGFRVVRQVPDAEPAGIRGGVAWVHVADLAAGYERRTARELVSGLHPGCRTPYVLLVDAWLLDAQPPASVLSAIRRRFEGWTEEQRRGWLRGRYPAYAGCGLREADFQRFP